MPNQDLNKGEIRFSGRDACFPQMCYCTQTGWLYRSSWLESYLESLNLVGIDCRKILLTASPPVPRTTMKCSRLSARLGVTQMARGAGNTPYSWPVLGPPRLLASSQRCREMARQVQWSIPFSSPSVVLMDGTWPRHFTSSNLGFSKSKGRVQSGSSLG